jgi:hypothetical protein
LRARSGVELPIETYHAHPVSRHPLVCRQKTLPFELRPVSRQRRHVYFNNLPYSCNAARRAQHRERLLPRHRPGESPVLPGPAPCASPDQVTKRQQPHLPNINTIRTYAVEGRDWDRRLPGGPASPASVYHFRTLLSRKCRTCVSPDYNQLGGTSCRLHKPFTTPSIA